MNPRLEKLMAEAKQDNNLEKIVCIEDIFRLKKLMYGAGFCQHTEWIDDKEAGKLFDHLYDLDICSLQVIIKGYEKQYNDAIKSKLQEA